MDRAARSRRPRADRRSSPATRSRPTSRAGPRLALPDGTLMRLASATTITLDSAHFTKTGTLHDAKILQQVGRTFTNVQHLVSGATFQVAGQSATATVRGTKFEVYIKSDGTMTVKLFEGTLDFDGKNHVHLVRASRRRPTRTAISGGRVRSSRTPMTRSALRSPPLTPPRPGPPSAPSRTMSALRSTTASSNTSPTAMRGAASSKARSAIRAAR